jgi:hypothetical protein
MPTTNAACATPQFKSQNGASPIHPGEAHKTRAELHGKDLTVMADRKIAWRGENASVGRYARHSENVAARWISLQ